MSDVVTLVGSPLPPTDEDIRRRYDRGTPPCGHWNWIARLAWEPIPIVVETWVTNGVAWACVPSIRETAGGMPAQQAIALVDADRWWPWCDEPETDGGEG